MEYKKIAVKDIKPNEWNPNKMTDRMMTHLLEEYKRIGCVQPILINKKNIIIDGEHRWKAAKEFGLKEIPCIQVDMDERDAKITTVNMNQIKGEVDPLKLADLLISLEDDFNVKEVGEMLRMNEFEIDTLKMLKNLPEAEITIEETPTPTVAQDKTIATLFLDKKQMSKLRQQVGDVSNEKVFSLINYFVFEKGEEDGREEAKPKGNS